MAERLIITRKGEWFNRRQNYKVFINDVEIGTIKNDDTQEYILKPGNYVLQCRHNWMSSAPFPFVIRTGANTRVRLRNGMRYIVPLYIMMMIGIIFPLYFSFARLPRPTNSDIIKLILILPALIYMLSYLTLLRNRYLLLSFDEENPFA